MSTPLKKITKTEKQFARLLAEGIGSIAAGRKVFGWRCEPNSRESQQVRDLARSARVKRERKAIEDRLTKEAEAEAIVNSGAKLDWSNLRKFAYDRLIEMRDDPSIPARPRFQAIQTLERLSDPSKDINLIFRWVDIMWRFYTAHCPCCHNDFPLWKIYNDKLNVYRLKNDIPMDSEIESTLNRRLALLKEAEKRKEPHKGQLLALGAEERHIVGLGAARGGKSFLLGMFALMFVLVPGAETWLLGQSYSIARKEFEYLENFLKTLFYPVSEHMYSISIDKKSMEATITTRWGSEFRIKSAKSQGSITGSELEGALIAEPAWVDDELYEEVRARMSSRLGRILALGTPKGFGGFLHRMTKAVRSEDGRMVKPEDRLIKNGCDWGKSMLIYTMPASDNPEYVISEIEAAKGELTEAEFASEFEGKMVAATGAKFPYTTEATLIQVPKNFIANCSFVLGIDQGPRNFGATLVGWDGDKAYVLYEYFDSSDATIKANMINLNSTIPGIIGMIGGNPDNWQLTIFDVDPQVDGILEELKDESRKWKTEIDFRPKNFKDQTNWREETTRWINQMMGSGKMFLDSPSCDLLHAQLQEVIIKPPAAGKESKAGSDKGWIVRDVWRGDHVLDALMLACYTLQTESVETPEITHHSENSFIEAKKGFDYSRMVNEQAELTGGVSNKQTQEMFQEVFGRPRGKGNNEVPSRWGYYPDES